MRDQSTDRIKIFLQYLKIKIDEFIITQSVDIRFFCGN